MRWYREGSSIEDCALRYSGLAGGRRERLGGQLVEFVEPFFRILNERFEEYPLRHAPDADAVSFKPKLARQPDGLAVAVLEELRDVGFGHFRNPRILFKRIYQSYIPCKGMAQNGCLRNERSQYPRKNSSSSAIRRTCQSSRGWLFTFSRHSPSSVKLRDTSNIGLLLSSRTEIVCSPRLNITD